MPQRPIISVVLPVYNGERFLRKAIESVLSQTFTDWELLIVNDGSKDSSPAICDELATTDKRIRVFHQANGGVNSARAKGIDHSRGEYLTFLDADDQLYPTALAFMSGLFRNGIDIVAHGSSETVFGKSDYLKSLWRGEIGPELWGKMFRSSLFREIDYTLERRLAMGEDLLLNSILGLNITSALVFPQEVYCVNLHNEASVTKTFKHNWAYEKYYFSRVDELFLKQCRNWDSFGEIELLINKSWLNAMKYTMLNGERINYKDPEFKTIRDYFKDKKTRLGPSERMVFCIRNPFLYRIILRTVLKLKYR